MFRKRLRKFYACHSVQGAYYPEHQAKLLYVNGAPQPVLVVNDLKPSNTEGAIAFLLAPERKLISGTYGSGIRLALNNENLR